MVNEFTLMSGVDIPIPEAQLILHQPKLREIAFIGEKEFLLGVQCVCVDKKMALEDESRLETTTNFQIFMTVLQDQNARQQKKMVIDTLSVMFPDYSAVFTPRALVFMPQDKTSGLPNVTIDDNNFEAIQDVIRYVCCLRGGKGDQTTFNPSDRKAKEIADKLMRGRARVAAQKGTQETSVFAQYASVLTVGLHSMSLQEVLDLTMYQLYDLVERFSLYTNWDVDVRARMAGAKGDKPLEDWMRSLHA